MNTFSLNAVLLAMLSPSSSLLNTDFWQLGNDKAANDSQGKSNHNQI